jgi:hypothetical protein
MEKHWIADFISTYIPCSILILSKFFYLPTDAPVNCLKNNFKIYIKIYIKTATYFGAVTPSSLFDLAKVTTVTLASVNNALLDDGVTAPKHIAVLM